MVEENVMPAKRIYSLDFFKLLLAFVVALHHLELPFSSGAELAVEVFFILSGFFLAKKFYSATFQKGDCGLSSWDYTLNHAKSIYPQFLFALAVYIAYLLLRSLIYMVLSPSANDLTELVSFLYAQIPELLLMHCSIYYMNTLLYPTWQLSAILICGYFLYELLRQNEARTRRIILPAAVLMVQCLLHSGVDLFACYGPLLVPLLRGFSSMGLGVLTWYFFGTPYYSKVYSHKKAVNLFSLYAIAMLALYQCRSRIYLITIPFLILLLQEPDCWLNHILNRNIFRRCGRLSLAVFVNHSLIARIVKNFILERVSIQPWLTALIYIFALTLYSIFTIWAVDRLTVWFHKRKQIPSMDQEENSL